jgi:hypothetical protein
MGYLYRPKLKRVVHPRGFHTRESGSRARDDAYRHDQGRGAVSGYYLSYGLACEVPRLRTGSRNHSARM